MSTSLSPHTKSKSIELVDYFEARKDDFKMVLHKSVDADTFMRTFKNAVLRDPKIAEADTTSVFVECQKAAQDGLVLDGREAVLTRFNTNKRYKDEQGKWRDNWIVAVTYIPMVFGIKKRVRNSAQIRNWIIDLVYENEHKLGLFEYDKFATPPIKHRPMIVGDPGEIIGAYSAVLLRDHTWSVEFMTVEAMNKIRSRTKSKNDKGEITGPWANDLGEMYKKTVVRRHSKNLPVSSEDLTPMLQRVDGLYDYDADPDGSFSDKEDAPAAVRNKRTKSAADTLKDAVEARSAQMAASEEAGETVDESTGEVLDGEIVDEDDQGEDQDHRDYDPDDQF